MIGVIALVLNCARMGLLGTISSKAMKFPMGLRLVATIMCSRNGCQLRKDGDTYVIRKGNRQIRMASKHLLYTYGTAEHFDTYFSQTHPASIGGVEEVDYSKPKLHRMADGKDLELSGLPEEAGAIESYFRFYTPKTGDLVFDIGAYCGVSTIRFAELVGTSGRVVAFEPDPVNLPILLRNIERSGLSNVTVVKAAISNEAGLRLFNSDGNLSSGLASSFDSKRDSSHVFVETITFPHACEIYGTPQFVKVDAEGAELEIVSGALDLLREHDIQFALDTSHIRNRTQTAHPVEALFARCGYAATSEEVGGLMATWAQKDRTLCLPR
jgi:FkbM family methyltransferase